MDPGSGVLDCGDLLVEGDTITAIGPDLSRDGGAAVVDATGTILTPGFVDTHRHAWETQLRRIMPDVDDLGAYVMSTLAGYVTVYRPKDMYVGTKLAALTAIDSGPEQHAAQRPDRDHRPGRGRPQHQRRPHQRRSPQVERAGP
ncbi:hypothetical protein [Streptomyces sp. G-G2]|uniref:hypothetical protein n=1 Tax=Streptomyces sp. G-G2 TaxID=3046201 RepID=UPI0024BBDD19|nr:hypothetical protein [Streptomyces sp. G-G2]MDJ0386261.1 hypothetical protein [Streptomyces sp. G-G2]